MEELPDHTALRILMTTDTVGGVWNYSLELCTVLQPFNVHFYLVTTGALMQPAQRSQLAQLENLTVYETGFMLEWMESPWKSIDESGAWLLNLESVLQPDLIHLNGYAYGSLPWKAPVLVAAHSDVYSWWLAVKKEQPPEHWREYFTRVQAGLQMADLVIAPSKTMMKHIREIYSVTTKTKVIYNGRSASVFKPAQKLPVVFSMGRIWDEAKNTRLLIDAAPQIPYPIRVAGQSSFGVNGCEVEGANVSYLGSLPAGDIATELSLASVYVHPAKYEPFGLSVLEAALSGCALVLGNIDSLKELWEDNAIYVDTDDVNTLAQTVNNLMNDDDLRLSIAERAMLHAANYRNSGVAENYLGVYHQLNERNLLQGNPQR